MIPFHKHLCPSCHTIPHAKVKVISILVLDAKKSKLIFFLHILGYQLDAKIKCKHYCFRSGWRQTPQMGWTSFTQVPIENPNNINDFTLVYWTDNESRQVYITSIEGPKNVHVNLDLNQWQIIWNPAEMKEKTQMILQCNWEKRKAIQSLGANLHWHKWGMSMPCPAYLIWKPSLAAVLIVLFFPIYLSIDRHAKKNSSAFFQFLWPSSMQNCNLITDFFIYLSHNMFRHLKSCSRGETFFAMDLDSCSRLKARD